MTRKEGKTMTGERLSWLIRTLGTSGKDLSEYIGIDKSTMSKWRKGKRTLRYDSEHAQRIAAWAMNSDVERKTGVLTRMLREWQPSLPLESISAALLAAAEVLAKTE